MARQSFHKPSPFDALKIAQKINKSQPPKPSTIQTATRPDSQTSEQLPVKGLAKSTDPSFTKFTTYVRKQTHLAIKTRLVSQGREMSALVEELLSDWLTKEMNLPPS